MGLMMKFWGHRDISFCSRDRRSQILSEKKTDFEAPPFGAQIIFGWNLSCNRKYSYNFLLISQLRNKI